MAALSPFSGSLFCSRPPNRHRCYLWRPLVISCSAPTGKSRASKKPMRDADLCKGLREFVSSFGFPDGYVPSTKELAERGRKDLANIVRRRGYKVVRELLANQMEVNEGSNLEDSIIEEQNVLHGFEVNITGQGMRVLDVNEEASNSAEGVSSSEDRLQAEVGSQVNLDDKNGMPIGPNCSSLRERVEKLLKYGSFNFDVVEDNFSGNFLPNDARACGEYNGNSTGSNSSVQDQENSRSVASGRNHLLNGTAVMSKPIANSTPARDKMRNNGLSLEAPSDAAFDQAINVKASEMENQAEIDNLKHMLQQKELELSRLRNLIVKEEETLSSLQNQAEDEIKRAQKLLSEMDSELLAAEESLAGLKEVQIQYIGEGKLIEVAGSFNGWDQRIKMDPHPSSTSKDPAEHRNSRLWSTVLWLYPGEYEIKFVIDGEWKVDPERETTSRSGLHNNILQVDR